MKVHCMDECGKNIDSRYKLCVLVSKRASELVKYLFAQRRMERTRIIGPLVNTESHDPLEIAFNEVKEGKVTLKEKK